MLEASMSMISCVAWFVAGFLFCLLLVATVSNNRNF